MGGLDDGSVLGTLERAASAPGQAGVPVVRDAAPGLEIRNEVSVPDLEPPGEEALS